MEAVCVELQTRTDEARRVLLLLDTIPELRAAL